MPHRAQLRICHQQIGTDHEWRWCELHAHAWCHDCGYYVCQIHMTARHELHKTQLVTAGA
jgi:hypothetical protein